MSKFITKETINRLLKDVKQLIKFPLTDNGIYYIHDDTDILKGYAMIVGPEDTPYFGGYYLFEFMFPYDYPFSPPKLTFMTNNGVTRFNPNLYKCGKVCVSILNTWSGDKWSSCQTINSILLTLCSILNNEPLLNEPGQNKNSFDFEPYQKSIEYVNIDFAICDLLLLKQKTNYNEKMTNLISLFYPFMKDKFIINYDKILSFITLKEKEKENEISRVRIYSMTTNIDYKVLKDKLIETKKSIDFIFINKIETNI